MYSYPIPQSPLTHTEEIKRSRFIVDLAHTQGQEQVKAFIQSIRAKYPDAGHHCWAYMAAAPDNSVHIGCSDDGEPSGTAGRPMLAQLKGAGVGEVTAVVSRYFGGIKLGTGGLVKAYGGSVQTALKQLVLEEKIHQSELKLVCDYADQSVLLHLLNDMHGKMLDQGFSEQVALTISIPSIALDRFKAASVNRTQGRVRFINTEL